MKKLTKIALGVLTAFALCFMANIAVVNAAEKVEGTVYINETTDKNGNYINVMKQRIYTDNVETIAHVECSAGCKIVNLRSNSPALTVDVTRQRNYDATITGYATKPNTGAKSYTVTFGVQDNTGAMKGNYTMKVQAVDSTSVVKTVKYGKQTIQTSSVKRKKGVKTSTSTTNYKASKKSGKLKLTANSQYKITGIIVVSVGKNGKYTYKKVKNGKKINLSKKLSYSEKSADGSSYKSSKKRTYVCVSYKDKFFGSKQTYSITKKRGIKEVKSVFTNGTTGISSTDYEETPSTFSLWTY